jgi:hypothetical protein
LQTLNLSDYSFRTLNNQQLEALNVRPFNALNNPNQNSLIVQPHLGEAISLKDTGALMPKHCHAAMFII